MTAPTGTYAAWRRLSGRPGGTRLFSAAAMARVPYFASVLPHVVRMEPGLAEARVPKWFMYKPSNIYHGSKFAETPIYSRRV
jgi:uncharacterized protein DUF4442